MWTTVQSYADSLAGRLMLGFVDACASHPVLVVALFGLMLGLVLTLWAEMLQLGHDTAGSPGRRPAPRHGP